jgi:hypothetical protein
LPAADAVEAAWRWLGGPNDRLAGNTRKAWLAVAEWRQKAQTPKENIRVRACDMAEADLGREAWAPWNGANCPNESETLAAIARAERECPAAVEALAWATARLFAVEGMAFEGSSRAAEWAIGLARSDGQWAVRLLGAFSRQSLRRMPQPRGFCALAFEGGPLEPLWAAAQDAAGAGAWERDGAWRLLETEWWGEEAARRWGEPPAAAAARALDAREELASARESRRNERADQGGEPRRWDGESLREGRLSVGMSEAQALAAKDLRELVDREREAERACSDRLLEIAWSEVAADQKRASEWARSPGFSREARGRLRRAMIARELPCVQRCPWAWHIEALHGLGRGDDAMFEESLALIEISQSRPAGAPLPRRTDNGGLFSGPLLVLPGTRLMLHPGTLALAALALGRLDALETLRAKGAPMPSARAFWRQRAAFRAVLERQPKFGPLAAKGGSPDELLAPMLSAWQKLQISGAIEQRQTAEEASQSVAQASKETPGDEEPALRRGAPRL